MAVAAAMDMYKKSSLIKSIPHPSPLPEGEGTDWGMLTINGGLSVVVN